MEKRNSEKLIIPKHVQKEMMEFFMRTSIPRKIELDKLNVKEIIQENPLPKESG